jgi:hypothetical protein
MAEYSTTLYDTAEFGTSGDVDHILFQEAQGASATATKSKTNSRGAGSLPENESFLVDSLHVSADFNGSVADYMNLWIDSYVEIQLSDQTVFQAPLRQLASLNSYGGHYSQGSASDEATIGLEGMGYKLRQPIKIEGGRSFRVNVHQGTALSGANSSVKFTFEGTLTRQ